MNITDPFNGKMAVYKPNWGSDWDNIEHVCTACHKKLLRNLGWYVYYPNPTFFVKNYFVCSEECGEVFILAVC